MNPFRVILADHPSELGAMVAQRLINYIEQVPDGVIALPTGKTPTSLIQALKRLPSIPDTKRLRFVQLDEYYPLLPSDEASFCFFVHKHYLASLKIAPEHSLTMEGLIGPTLCAHGIERVFPGARADLTLLQIEPSTAEQQLQKTALEEAVQFCTAYERTIADWGGIGFFLGGIGLDGHIAFNPSGSSFDSKTRLVDLGGRLAATIGMKTICNQREMQAILFAVGDEKATIVAQAIEGPISTQVPASGLRMLNNNPTFYLTKDAARKLRNC